MANREDHMSKMNRRDFTKGGAALAPLAFAPFSLTAQTAPSDKFDIVVAGAGHNSLVTAAYLAKAGYRVVVLEYRPQVGGGVKTEEVTLPGFKHDTCSTPHGASKANPVMRNDGLHLIAITASSTSRPIRSTTCLSLTEVTSPNG